MTAMRVCGQVVHLSQTADGSRNSRKGSWTGYTPVAQRTDHTTGVSVCGQVIHSGQITQQVYVCVDRSYTVDRSHNRCKCVWTGHTPVTST